MNGNLYLRKLTRLAGRSAEEYPLTADVMRSFTEWELTRPVTILCGENGCGKSTLLEIAAAAVSANRIGRQPPEPDEKRLLLARHAKDFRITGLHPKRNFFFSAEDFIKYIDWVESTKAEARAAIAEVDRRGLTGYAAGQAKMPHYHTLSDLSGMYANALAKQSHGEGFLDFFRARIGEDGLFLMDEPEGALSYENQYLLARIVMESVREGCQFVIATHSPVISAIPGAEILEIREGRLVPCAYEEVANNRFLEMFMKHRARLMREDEAAE